MGIWLLVIISIISGFGTLFCSVSLVELSTISEKEKEEWEEQHSMSHKKRMEMIGFFFLSCGLAFAFSLQQLGLRWINSH
jgi:hypothetical protein